MKLILRKAISKKSNNPYVALMVDLGYVKKFLSFSANDIAEILGMSVIDLMNKPDGDYVVARIVAEGGAK